MKGLKNIYKVNKLAPLGFLASISCFIGVIIPWKTTHLGPINGILEPTGWFILILLILYLMLLFAHFKWNIVLAIVILVMSIFELTHLKTEIKNLEDAQLGFGVPLVIISSIIMIISKILLFRKRSG